jgi:3-isopropylmalate dehydrogenase
MTNRSLLILPGDGIGPEVMAEVRKVIDWFGTRGITFDVSEDLVGGCAYDAHGTPLTDATMAKAQEVDAVLLGAVGGPKYDVLDFSVKPERGLLRLRKEMDLYANLRPAQCFDALADFSSLKKDVVAGLDIMIIRELTSAMSAWASTPSATPRARLPALPGRRSSWRASAATRSARWKRPM